MGGLKFCLDKIGLGEHEAAILTGKVDDRKAEGYEAHEAAVGAVEDHIKELERDRREIEMQVTSKLGFEFDDIQRKKHEAKPAQTPLVEWQNARPGDVVGNETTGFHQIIARNVSLKADAKKLAENVGGEVILDGPDKWAVWRPVDNPAAARRFVLGPKEQPRGKAEKTVSRLLYQLGIPFEILEGSDYYLVVKKEPYLDLVIERHQHPSGNDAIYFTHYIHDKEGSGDTWIDSEMIYAVTEQGSLVLIETAVPNPLTGGEYRARDRSYALMFAKNLIAQGFGTRWESMIKGHEKTEIKPEQKPLTENQKLTIERLGPVGTKVQFTYGFNREVMTISDIEPENGRVAVEGGGNIYREASEFKRAEEAKAPAPNYDQIRAELEKEKTYITPEKIIYAIEKTIADEWQYVKSYPSGLVVRSRTEETEKRAIDSVIDDIERDAKIGPAKPAEPGPWVVSNNERWGPKGYFYLVNEKTSQLYNRGKGGIVKEGDAEGLARLHELANELNQKGDEEAPPNERLENKILKAFGTQFENGQVGALTLTERYLAGEDAGEVAAAIQRLIDTQQIVKVTTPQGVVIYYLAKPLEPGGIGAKQKELEDQALRKIRNAGGSIGEANLIIDGATQDQQAQVVQGLIEKGQLRRIDRGGDSVLELTEEESEGSPRARGASQQLGYWVLKKIESKETFNWRELFEAADRYFGGTQAEGKYTPKDAYDAMELGVNFAIQRSLTIDMDASPDVAKRTINDLKAVIDRLPTQTKRTQEQIEYQQFSTPPPLAYVVGWTLKMDPEDVFLEPSAGIGGILVFAINADVKEVYANELSKRRAAILQSLRINRIFTEDAEQLNNILPHEIRPTIIGMNPPFSSTAGRTSTNRTKYGARHIEQALARLHPNGRLVAIVGRGMADNAPAFSAWWKTIKARYNVRANISISGQEYAKYGTTFDNQIIVIDKNGPTKYNPVTGHADKIEDLIPLLEGVRNDRPSLLAGDQGTQPASDKPTVPSTPGTPESTDRPPAALPGPTDNLGAGEGAAGTGAGASGLPSGAPGSRPGGRGGTATTGEPQPSDSQPDINSPGLSGGTPRPDEGDRAGGRGSVDQDIDDLLDFSKKEAEKKAAEETPAPAPEPTEKPKDEETVIVLGNPISKLYVTGAYEKKLGAGTGLADRAWNILKRNEQKGLKDGATEIAGMATDLLNRPQSSYIDIDYIIQTILKDAGYSVKTNEVGEVEVKPPTAQAPAPGPQTVTGKELRKGDRVRWEDSPGTFYEGTVKSVTVQYAAIEVREGHTEHKLLTQEFELLERGAPTAPKKPPKEKKPRAPKKPRDVLITPVTPPLLTPEEKDMAKKKAEEAQKKIDEATKEFNDLFLSVETDPKADFDPQKWPAVHMALTKMWEGFKDAIADLKEAAKTFIRHAYSKLPSKGKVYIDKFIQEDIRAALESKKKEDEQLPPNELDYTDQGNNKAESPQEIKDSLFDDYKPRVIIPGAQPHPSKLVQSVAMADTELPTPIYKLLIPMKVIENGNISEAQIEAIVYSNQSFEVVLPDGRRRGFFIGDGTGVGKGREIGAIIWENYLRGRKKAVWVSEKPDLMKDAARDLYGEQEDPKTGKRRITGIGWEHGRKILFKAPNATPPKRKKGEPPRPRGRRGVAGVQEEVLPLPAITREEGIMFISYASLRKSFENIRPDQPESLEDMTVRLNQVVKWLGRDFDGVIAFDEAHNMRNLAPAAGARGSKPPAKQAQAGMLLSTLLPNARIVYVSATGAVEVENLVYADRLGLWGLGTAFTNGMRFVGSLLRSGIAGMEMIARDLKARGLYIARALSYDDVEYDRMTHRLSDRQRASYDKMAEAWQGIFRGIHEAMQHTGGKKGQMWSMFWGSQQRFFDSVVTAMQMPSVIESAERDLDNNKSVIFQLTKTGNAQAKRAYDRKEADQELEDLDLSPKEVLIDFLLKYFPIQQWEPFTDPNTGRPGMRPVYDSEGNPVINEEAREIRDGLIADVNTIQGIPTSPLDMILQHFGQDNVAEVTSRPFRFVYNDEGKLIKEAWSKDKSVKDAATFMDFKKRVLVFSEAGGTGASYHADLDSKNQQPRVHYLLQSGWNAVRAVQGLGRSHRSNQASAPKFWLVTTDIKGQMRFISTIARRLDQLGALTKGQRQTGSQGIFQARDNLENEYAREALVSLLLDIQNGNLVDPDGNVLITPAEFHMETGIALKDRDGQNVPPNDFPEAPRFLNRALAMTLGRQEMIFDEFFARIDSVVTRHAEAGTLDVGIETISGTSVRKVSEQTVNIDELTAAETKYIQIDVEKPTHNITFEASKELFNYRVHDVQYFRNVHSGRVWVASDVRSRSSAGQTTVYKTLRGPSESSVQQVEMGVLSESDKWEDLNEEQAEQLWNEEFKKLPASRNETHHVLTAPLLPIWDRLQGDTRIYRMQTDDGERILGRVIPERLLAVTLENLGVTIELRNYDPAEVHREVLEHGATATLVNGWQIKRVNLSGDDRIEIVGPEFYDFQSISRYGVFQETVQFKRRFFIPTDARGIKTIEELIRYKQVRTLERPYAGPVLSFETYDISETAELEAKFADAPEFTTTQEARLYGQESDKAGAEKMLEFYAIAKLLAKRYVEADDFNRAMIMASRAQYYREAYDGYLGADNDIVAATEKWLAEKKQGIYPSVVTPSDSPFYSQMHDHLSEKLPGSGKPADFQKMIAKWAQEGKFKAEEMEWSGILDALAQEPGDKVTKAKLLSWLSLNNIQVHETLFGEADSKIKANMNALKRNGWYIEYDADDDTEPLSLRVPSDRRDEDGRKYSMTLYLREIDSDEEVQSNIEYLVERGIIWPEEREMIVEAASLVDAPRAIYSGYQFGGAHNYRELVLSIPANPPPPYNPVDSSGWKVITVETYEYTGQRDISIRDSDGVTVSTRFGFRGTDEEAIADAVKDENERALKESKNVSPYTNFFSTHYKMPNPVVHMRFNEREQPTYTAEQAEDIGRRIAAALGISDPDNIASGATLAKAVKAVITPLEAAQYSHYRGFQNDTTGATERILFVEEIQSDWHQKGRKLGYQNPVHQRIIAKSEAGEKLTDEEMRVYREEMNSQLVSVTGQVPDAPFKSTWPMLAMKRMVRWAAENGFDRIAWATGEQQIDRYNEALRQNVDQISWAHIGDPGIAQLPADKLPSGYRLVKKVGENLWRVKDHENAAITIWMDSPGQAIADAKRIIAEYNLNGSSFIQVVAKKDDKTTFSGKVIEGKFVTGPGKGKSLEEVLGKKIGEQIVKERLGSLKGKDLSIGGQLHKFIYNVNLPQEMNKFFGKKAWGNARVEPYGIDLGRTGPAHFGPYTGPVPSIEELRHKATRWNTPVQISQQLIAISDDMDRNGTPFEDAIRRHGSMAIAELWGGKMEWVYPPMEAWSIRVTPEMRGKAVEKGFPLFSIKRMSPVAKTYLEALRAAMPSQFITSQEDTKADPFAGLRDEVKERMVSSKGVPFAGFLKSAQIHGRDVWHSMTRHRPFLDAEEQATVADVLRTHQDGPDNAIRRAMQVLQNIVGGMKPKQYEVFSLRIIMDDMIRDIDSGLLANKDELPFGFTETEARQYRDYLQLISDSDPIISSAFDRRQAFQEKMKLALVEADLLPKAVLEDDRYFHHQVLIYRAKAAMGEAYSGLGVGSDDVRLKRKGWQIGRVGSVADYNTEYAESEFEVLSQGFSQLETRETLDRIRALVDISSNLRAQAKQQNKTLFYDLEAARINRLNPNNPSLTGDDIIDTDMDPLKTYKQTIAIATSKLRKMAKDNKFVGVGQEWDDVITDLATGGRAAGGPMMEQSRFFAFLNHLMKAQLPGAVYAGTIRKAIAERDKYIKLTLGSRFVTVKKLIPEGFTPWKPTPGKSWYKAYSLSDRLVAAVQAGEMVIGQDNADKITRVLARGRDVEWIIPTGVAQTLDGFDKAHDDQKLSRASKAAMSAWKKWILVNPYRVFRYNLNNLSGDMDIAFAYDPKIVTHYLFKAMKDLTTEYRGKKELPQALQKELDLAYELSVLDSGWSFQEVSELTKNLALMEKMEALRGDRPNVIKRGWRNLKEFTRFRENWLRLAAFRYFRDQIAAGHTVYGASNRAEVDGITDPDRKAAKLARELIGDYGNISHAGKFIRDHLLPFYSWMEINMPRYVRLMRNFRHEGRSGQARLAAVFGKNVVWKATKLAVKVSGFFVAVNLWNATFFADEEDELSEDQRRQLHLILGRRADGSIRTLRIQGAFSDALSWFGAEDIIQDVEAYYKGRKSFGDIAKDSVLATPIKIINAFRPDLKTGSEVLAEQAFYPDPFNPRPIRDKMEHVARMFSADSLYRWLAGKPKRGDNVGERMANDLMAIGFYYSDPGESAYYETISKVIKYREGKGKEYPGVTPTDKANALYYYKQGLKFGDLGAAEKYLRQYYALGGSDEGMDRSIQRAHPLGNLAKKDWGAYLKTLSPEGMNTYRRALAWYQDTYLKAPKAQLRAAAKRPAGGANDSKPAKKRLTLKEAAKLMQ